MYDELQIIKWPDPRLKKASVAVTTFDDNLKTLSDRMFTLMREAKGVGLAAPQVGVNIRLFVMNATGQPEGDRVYINPVLTEGSGSDEDEEGCLSLPTIYIPVLRDETLTMTAKDLTGQPIAETATGFVARVWQHETDHLNGVLLTDRMGPVAKMTFRKKLKELEEDYAIANPKKKR